MGHGGVVEGEWERTFVGRAPVPLPTIGVYAASTPPLALAGSTFSPWAMKFGGCYPTPPPNVIAPPLVLADVVFADDPFA